MNSFQNLKPRIPLHRTLTAVMISRSICILISVFLTTQVEAQSDSLRFTLGKLGKTPVQQKDTVITNNAVKMNGRVNVVADSAIVSLERGTRKFKDTKGYRIQIFLGTVSEASKERNKYLSLGLPYSVYSKQIVPEQALQVGDFINRMEMEKHLEIIKKNYPKAFGVVSFIEPPKFSGSKKSR